MARITRFSFVVIAVLFHVVYISSIFDIYFVSPIVHGMTAFPVRRPAAAEAPAQRLVLYVGDGLRADKAMQSFPDPRPANPDDPAALTPRPLMPFVRSRIQEHGTFGVSHTRVPTESRPGHVALIAGLYEDVSAVVTGWKLNPVNFDSVFNRSRHTWSWGSPDILPMFKEGAVEGRVDADSYDHDFEDFTADALQLDTWVFDKVEDFLKEAATNKTLDGMLRKDKNVFFLHLLGLDTNGHAYRPYSKEYLHNIQVVDEGVKKTTKLIDDFFNDGKTAYVFTADHGMSDWGSHGDGHPNNTRTPLVAWGSGVKKPVTVKKGGIAPGHEDGYSSDWGLDHVARHDVEQADVAALMAYLAGVEFPTNSVGKLPLEFLSGSSSEQAEAALTNVEGLMEMYRVKEEHKQAAVFNYKPYPAFAAGETSATSRITAIRALIDQGHHDKAIAESHELLDTCLQGLRYLQTYDWLFLRALVTAGYLGWIAFAIATVIDLHVLHGKTETSRSAASFGAFVAIGVGLFSFLAARRSPVSYYAYAIFPVVFWEEVFARKRALSAGRQQLLGHISSVTDWLQLGIKSLAVVAVMEALVISYFHREVYTACYLVAIAWPFFYGTSFLKQNKALVANWALGCALMSTFTLFPALKVEDSNLILLGGSLMLSVGVFYLLFGSWVVGTSKAVDQKTNIVSRALVGVQVALILVAMIVTRSSVASLQARQGLPILNQVVGWLVLVSSLGMPFLHSLYPNKHYLHRLLIIFLTFSPTFVILTISIEGLFYFGFCLTLVAWVRMEHHIFTFTRQNIARPAETMPKLKPLKQAAEGVATQLQSADEGDAQHQYRSLTLADVRTALFFFFFIQSGFFSTGNIASVSAFSLESVHRLIPVFDPFSQAALLIVKLMVPFAVISANLGILNRRLGVAPSSLFMVVMAISDVMTMNFFWMVKDEGSWLDIGTTISHFFIASLLCAFVSVLEFVSEIFVGGVDMGEADAAGARSNGAAAASNGKAAAGKAAKRSK